MHCKVSNPIKYSSMKILNQSVALIYILIILSYENNYTQHFTYSRSMQFLFPTPRSEQVSANECNINIISHPSHHKCRAKHRFQSSKRHVLMKISEVCQTRRPASSEYIRSLISSICWSNCSQHTANIYTMGHTKCATLPIIDRFSKFFHWHTLQTICNNVIIIYPTTR